MSFGFSIGDLITVIEKANQLRKDFIGAPPQFKALSDELRNLEIVIRDLEVDQHNTHLNATQKQELQDIANSCRTVFNEIDTLLSRYCEIDAARPIKRTWKRLRWVPEDVHDLRNRLSSNISILNAFNGRITRDTISMLLKNKTEEKQRVCLDWLSPTTHATRQSEYLRLLQPGTGQWLLQSQNFLSWIDEPGKTMFCPGIPGAGKTILSSAVIDEIESRYSSNAEIGIAYIYCDFQHTSDGSQKPESFLSSIIRQLVLDLSPMPNAVQAMYDKHEPKGTRPTFAELSKAFSVVCRSFKRWFLVFDALDECNLSDATRTLDAIISHALDSNMSLFATSRFIPEIMSKFQGDAMTQEIRAEKSDIARYLTANLDQLPSFVSRNKQLQQEVIDVITNAVDGMFLLAQLSFSSLKGKITARDIRSSLKGLAQGSTNYDKAYENAMQRINSLPSEQKAMAHDVLSWITCARRPLTTAELLHALAVDRGDSELDNDNVPDLDFILFLCAGLVVVSGEKQPHEVMRLVHYTTQEYFERMSGHWFPDAHGNIAATCLTYVAFDAFQSGICLVDADFEVRICDYPLYTYAARNWAHHVLTQDPGLCLVMTFLRASCKVEASVQAIFSTKGLSNRGDYCRQIPAGLTGLHLAAFMGLPGPVKSFIDDGNQSPRLEPPDRSPLGWAAYAGHVSTVELLLSRGSDPNEMDTNGRATMSLAAYKGQASVLNLLLRYKVDPNYHDPDGQTPLLLSVDQGHEESTKVLLENNAEADCRDSDGQTPLFYAASNGWVRIAQLLLAKSADPNSRDVHGRTPLYQAIENAQPAIIRVLLYHGAQMDSSDARGVSPSTHQSLPSHQAPIQPSQEEGIVQRSHWERLDILRKTRKTRSYKCPFCPIDNGKVFRAFVRVKLHIGNIHYREFDYVCPEPSCTNGAERKIFYALDNLAGHLIRAHEWNKERTPLATKVTDQLKAPLPSPPNCPLCSSSLSSWLEFWKCMTIHIKRSSSSSQVDQSHGSEESNMDIDLDPSLIERSRTATP